MYTREATNFIEQSAGTPFFLYLSHTFPHAPHFADPEFAGSSAAGVYGDTIEDLDRSVGRVLDTLEKSGVLDNTLIIITNDNGGSFLGDAGSLRGRKGDTWEGGMRVPGIFYWRGNLSPDSVSDGMAMQIDVLPTVLNLAGIAPPADRVIDGKDIWPMLQGGGSPHEVLFYISQYTGVAQAVRNARFKYHDRGPAKQYDMFYPAVPFVISAFSQPMLTDLHNDRESYDLRNLYPNITDDLSRRLKEFRARMADDPRGFKSIGSEQMRSQ